MTFYSLLIYLHVASAVGMFSSWAVEAAAALRLRGAASVEEAALSVDLLIRTRPVVLVSMLTVLGTGIWMMIVRWGPQPWMTAALAAVGLLVVVGIAAARRARPLLSKAFAGGAEEPSPSFAGAARLLAASVQFRLAVGFGILGLMTVKPGAAGSAMFTGFAIAVGIGLGVHAMRQKTPAAVLGATRS